MRATILALPLVVASIVPLEGVRNCRAVSARLPGIYRAAQLEAASASDAVMLCQTLGVCTVIDLRNDDEIENECGGRLWRTETNEM